MAPPGLWTRPGVRGAPQGNPLRIEPVTTEAEMLAAITKVAAAGAAGEVYGPGFLGAHIRIVKPFAIEAPLHIPAKCRGLLIDAAGQIAITPRSALSCMFLIDGQDITLRGLFPQALSEAVFFDAFVRAGTEDFAGTRLRIEGGGGSVDRVFVDDDGNADNVRVADFEQQEVSATHDAAIVFRGDYCQVRGCTLSDGGGDTVTLGAGAMSCKVHGNELNGGDVTSTASDGDSTIVGNTGCGALTLHANDEEAANTP